MDKERVIKIRDTLKAGKNLPLRVYINNMYHIIDETKISQFTMWDDKNGILYVFKLQDPSTEVMVSNKDQGAILFAVDYDVIESLEIAFLQVSDMNAVFDSIASTGKEINANFKENVINFYTRVLSTDKADLSRDEINKLIGSKLPTGDDYYNGKMSESKKETAYINKYNESIK